MSSKIDTKYLISFFLRLGISIVFFYAAVASFLNPNNWIGFLPQWMRNIFPAELLLFAFSFYELILGTWLISGKKIFYAAILSSLTLFLIITSNISELDVLFRDIAILSSAVALILLSYKEK